MEKKKEKKELETQFEFDFEALYFRSKDPLNDYLNLIKHKKFHEFTYDDLVQYANLKFQLFPEEEAKELAKILRKRFFYKKEQNNYFEDIVAAELIKLCAKWIEENGKNRKSTRERKTLGKIFKLEQDADSFKELLKKLGVVNDDLTIAKYWHRKDIWFIITNIPKKYLNKEGVTNRDWEYAFNKEFPKIVIKAGQVKTNPTIKNLPNGIDKKKTILEEIPNYFPY